jgi:malonyl CoA-acyl carrier protein transacylase
MIDESKVINIEKVRYLNEYKLELFFNDGVEQVIDFGPFLSNSLNPLINKYLDLKEFRKYELDSGDLIWNDYDLCFPIADLYENKLKS